MKRAAFKLLEGMEVSWWYRGRAEAVRAQLANSNVKKSNEAALDYGAGFGGMRGELARVAAAQDAFEPDAYARDRLITRGYRTVFDDADAIPDKAYGLVGAFDVVEHIEDDREFLARIRRVLKPGGRIAITIPAFPFLWSVHDETHLHFRRYTKKGICALLKETGYVVQSASYWNFVLFIPTALVRLMGNTGESGLSMPAPINALLLALMRIEAALMRLIPFPWGTGLVVIARVPEEGSVSVRTGSLASRYAFFIRYLIVGVSGGIIQTATLFVWVQLLGLQRIYLWGVVLGFLFALAETFLLQKVWTFRDASKKGAHKQFISYTLVAFLNLALNTFFVRAMKALADAHSTDFFHVWYLLAQMGAVVIVAALSFFANYFITFRAVRTRTY